MKLGLEIPNSNEIELYYKFYSILFLLNNKQVTEKELELVSFVAYHLGISKEVKDEFCTKYNTTIASINNMISKLRKNKIFIKDEINPAIKFDISSGLELNIKFNL